MLICNDIAHARTHSVIRSADGNAVAERIEFVSLLLTALTPRMAKEQCVERHQSRSVFYFSP